MAHELGGQLSSDWQLARRYLEDDTAYEPILQLPEEERLPPGHPTCSFNADEHAQLQQSNMVEQLAPDEIPIAMSHIWGRAEMFKVPRRQRAITDTFVINKHMRHLKPAVIMCTLNDARQSVHHGHRTLTLDMKSWFVHFLLSYRVSLLQCHVFDGVYWRWLRLAMGLIFACFIAQVALNIITKFALRAACIECHHLTYVDNVKFTGDTPTLHAAGMSFAKICARANLTVGEFSDLHLNNDNFDEQSTIISDRLYKLIGAAREFIGLNIDHENKTISLTTKVLSKLTASTARQSEWTVRQACAHISLLIYATFATGRQAWPYYRVFKFLSTLHTAIYHTTARWSSPCSLVAPMDYVTQEELTTWTERALRNDPMPVIATDTLPKFLFVSDACATRFSCIAINLATGEVRCYADRWPHALPDSGESEPMAILTGLCVLFPHTLSAHVHCITDNTTAIGGFPAGRSKAAHLNSIIGTLATERPALHTTFEHVKGTENVMDGSSRGEVTLDTADLRRFLATRMQNPNIVYTNADELRFDDGQVHAY
jgi:hypothetical protein